MRIYRAITHHIRPLDRYVFSEYWRIFVSTALGFPVLLILIDLTDNLDKYLGRNIPRRDIALGYLYWLPDSMFLVLPAAVLFATVFAIGAFTRHSEVTAAKASGISFYRLIAPIFVGAVISAILGLLLGEVTPVTNARRAELIGEVKRQRTSDRFNFAYAAEDGRVYKISALDVDRRAITGVEIERKGNGPAYPTYILAAPMGEWTPERGWRLKDGNLHIVPDSNAHLTVGFDSIADRRFKEHPADLLAAPKDPHDMRFRELTRFIRSLERSGGDADELRVERMLKIAIPITCIIIAFFGAPLATSTQRGGAAYGIGVSLATTVTFLMTIQLTKAIGGQGILPPEVAAWIPNAVFGIIGAVLLARVRT
ncbi:MAG TPA: LptF/LptG family permease [Gemmatimonadaceae bacterium]|nr:LptF/LptG family permease [Gemmatimonadaceae bacterium]